MDDLKISFSLNDFNRLCPYYFLLDKDLNIISAGNDLKKQYLIIEKNPFVDYFSIKDPIVDQYSFFQLEQLANNQVTICHHKKPGILFQGQLTVLPDIKCILFTGKPSADFEKIPINDEDWLIANKTAEPEPSGESNEINYNIPFDQIQPGDDTILNDALKIFSQLISNISNGILMENEAGNVILVNQLYCDMFSIKESPFELNGKQSPMVLEKYLQALSYPEKVLEDSIKLSTRKKMVINQEMEMKDGRVLKRDFIPIFIEGIYKGNLWKISDISYIVMLRNKLEYQREFYEKILNKIPSSLAVLDKNGRYLYLNPESIKDEKIRKWIIGKTDREYTNYRGKPTEIADRRNEKFQEALTTRKQAEWEEKFVAANNKDEYQLRVYNPVFNEKSELEMMIAYGMNITERKAQEEKLVQSEQRYRDIFEFSQALICTHDLDGKVLSVNKTTTETLEFDKSELIGRSISSLLPDKLKSEFNSKYLAEIKENGKSEGVMVAISKTGKKLYLLYKNYLVSENTDNQPYVIGFSQDITERVIAEDALKKSEDKFRRIIENMNLGMVEVDLEEKILYSNHRFAEMAGFETEELIGQDISDLIFTNESKQIIKEKADLRKFGISDSYEMRIKNKRGELRWWLISGAPFYNTNGTLKGSIGIFLDISKQKMLEEELREAKLLADRSASSKEMFLANMSHEIRTPINAILGLGKLLRKSELGKQQLHYLDSILNATENLLVIINDVLDFSKIEAGKIDIESINFELKSLLMNAKSVLSPKIEEKGLKLAVEFDDRIHPVLIGDPYRLNQVIMNLMSNATKFTEKGSLTIKADLLETLGNSQKIAIRVIDTGIGMGEEFLEHIFDKFTQEDASVARKFGGTGLGMGISKQLVELMGGNMIVSSKKGMGTSINLEFEFVQGKIKDLPQRKEIKTDIGLLKNKHILLVEDNEMNRLVASTILEQYGAKVIEAENGIIAIDKIRKEVFDLILMDVQMPEMDGYEATGIIRNQLKLQVPVIALTANALKGEDEKCLKAGMNDFIPKPYDEERLVNMIAKWIGKNKGKVLVASPEPEYDGNLFDLSILESIGRGNDDFLVRLLKLFIEEVPESVRKIKEAYLVNDFKTIKFYAHRMKPSIINMNISLLREDIVTIESMASAGESSEKLEKLIEKLDNVIKQVVDKIKYDYQL